MRGHLIAGALLVFGLGACATPPETVPVETVHVTMTESPYAADFGILADLAGTRWRGEPGQADTEHTSPADISEWYWDLGGTVLVNRHALEDGTYGGITYVQKTKSTGALDYVYITSAGFRTTGSFTLTDDGEWSAYEKLEGLKDIIGVRSTGRIGQDGTLTSVSEFEKADGWVPGHTFIYTRTDAPMPDVTGQLDIE